MKQVKYTVKISVNLIDALTARGATDQTIDSIVDIVVNKIKRKNNMTVDTSDNSISYADIPISFIRNHDTREIYLLTRAEAFNLDVYAGKAQVVYSKEFIVALENLGYTGTKDIPTID